MQKCKTACVSLPAQFNGWNLQKSPPLENHLLRLHFLGLHVDFFRSDPILQPSHKFSVWGRSDDVRRASLLVLLEILLRIKNSDTFLINLKKHLKHDLQTKRGVVSKSRQLQKEGIRFSCGSDRWGEGSHHGFHLGRSMETSGC